MATALTTDAVNQVSEPFNSDLNPVGLSYGLSAYLYKPLAVQIGNPRKEKTLHLAGRIDKALPVKLRPDVLAKIARSRYQGIKRLSNTIEAINDNLITSTPEEVRLLKESVHYRKVLKWAYSLGAHSTDGVTREWKKFSALIKWCAIRSETGPPPIPQDFPGYSSTWGSPRCLPPLWRNLCPWLEKIMERGIKTKLEATRVLHLTTSRNFPAGGDATRKDSLRKHAMTVHSKPRANSTRSKILRRLSVLIGRQISRFRPKDQRSSGHLSMTSSASIDSPVSNGGRATEISTKFRSWCLTVPDQEENLLTWFGQPYRKVPGRPIWQTMCRQEPVHEPHHEFGESAENMNLDFENFKLEDPLYGLDEATGYQLLQWSIEEGISQGILEGTKYKGNDNLRLSGRAPSIRASAIGEPGAKSRIVTVGEDWLTMLLSPWAHHMIGELKIHPSATSGLTRGWQLFEWVKRLRNVSAPPQDNRYFLSSDLTTATDFCLHEYSKQMLVGLEIGLYGKLDPYHSLCIDLLCSGRQYEGPVPDYLDHVTSRGILMGDPGAKSVLTMHNLCAELEAFLRYTTDQVDVSDKEFLFFLMKTKGPPPEGWRHFACSGDDHFGQGPKEYLSCLTRNHNLNGMSVSWSQNFLSSVGGFYCEEMLLTVGLSDNQIWKSEIALRDTDYLKHPHIDAMKVRLFSPCAKEHEGKAEPNPAIGKARQMHGMLAWLGGGWESLKPVFSARWEQRMEKFLPSVLPFRYLPTSLGGIETPAYHRSKTEIRNEMRRLPQVHLWAIKQILDGTATPLVRRAVATFATNARARGISSDAIEDQIRQVLANAELCHGLDDSGLQLASNTPDLEWRNLRYKDKAAIAKRMRLTTIDEAINHIGRPYLFRDMLAPEVSRRHGIEPYRSLEYDSVSWETRQRKFYENLFSSLPENFTPLTVDEVSLTCNKIADWAVENKALDVPREIYFFPENVVVTSNLATLRTPL